jgi:hypothetical protein
MGFGVAALLIGMSIASYSHQKGTASNGKILNKSSLVNASYKPDQAKVKESVGKLPLSFEPNLGQTNSQVKYVARAKGYTAYLTGNETVLAIRGSAEGVLRMKMQNARPDAGIQAGDRQASKSNYVRKEGNISDVPNYGRVTYKGIYPGIDVAYYGNNLNLEYDFVVRPGADATQIRMGYEGSSRFELNKDGDLELQTAAGKTLARKPVVYQTIHGVRQAVQGEYVLTADNSVGFKLGAYDHSKALVIDPTLNVLAFLGSTAAGIVESDAWGIATNATGTPTGVYLTGRTASLTFPGGTVAGSPVTAHSPSPIGNFDVFVTALDPTGASLVFNTFIGSSGDEGGEGIVADAAGNLYVTGYTSDNMSSTAPVATSNPAPTGVSPGGVYSAFLAKLTAGKLAAITYLGGPGTTQAFAIAMDNSTNSGTGLPSASNGTLVIGGLTNGLVGTPSGEFKTYGGGLTDGFLATYTNALAPVASTYVGGGKYDQVNSVAVDSSCSPGAGGPPAPTFPACSAGIYAAGLTASGNVTTSPATAFPTGSTPGFDAAGNPNATFTATNLAVNPLPVGSISPGQQTAFALKYNSSLTERRYSSIFGPGGETANGIAVDGNGVAYVVGSTWQIAFDPGAPNAGGFVLPEAGSIPNTTPIFGTPVPGTPSLFGQAFQPFPSQTQGYLLALNPPVLASACLEVGHTCTENPLVNPQTQTIDFVALQKPGVLDPNVNGGLGVNPCNLGVQRFAGSIFGVPNNCTTTTSTNGAISITGFVQSWNGVGVDADDQVYIVGQAVAAGPVYVGELDRVRTGNLQTTPQTVTLTGANNTQLFAIAVDQFRLAFFDGIATGAAAAVLPTANLNTPAGVLTPVASGIKATTPAIFGVTKIDATTEGLYGAIQFIDDFVTPSVVNATPITATSPNGGVGVNTPTGDGGPIQTVTLTNQLGNPVDPALGCTANGTPFTVGDNLINEGPFTLQQVSNTNQIQIELGANATLDAGTLGPETVVISCAGAENNSTITINGSIYGPLDVTASATLLSGITSAFNTGIIIPYTTTIDGTFNVGNLFQNPTNPFVPAVVRVPVTVVTPGSPQNYTATITGQSANFPSQTCGLLGLDSSQSGGQGGAVTAGFAGTVTPPITGTAQTVTTRTTYGNGSIFAARINPTCVATLSPGTYTANIVINNASGGASTTVPFSLTITGGGVVSQNVLNLGFLNSAAAPQQTSFSVNAQGSSITYGTNYIPANPPLTPLPATNVLLVSGGSGTIANGITQSAIVQVTPAGLSPGVYTGTFQVVQTPVSNPVTVLGNATITVFVGYSGTPSVGVVTGSVGLVNIVPGVSDTVNNPIVISAPAGFSAANLNNPLQAVIPLQLGIAAVGDNASTPLFIGNTTGVPGVTAPTLLPTTPVPQGFSAFPAGTTTCFLPPGAAVTAPTSQPPCELQLSPTNTGTGPSSGSSSGGGSNNGNTCSTWAPSPQLGPGFQQCNYQISVDTTLLPPGNYSATATFTATNGDVLPVPITLAVTATPTLLITQTVPIGQPQAGQVVGPITTLNFSGAAGQNATTCQNITVGDTGGTLTGVNVSTASPWIAFGPLGTQAPPNFAAIFGGPTNMEITANLPRNQGVIVNPNVAMFEVCVNPVFAPSSSAGSFSGTINFVSSGGPKTITVNFNLNGGLGSTGTSGTGNPANFQQIGVFRSLVAGALPGTALGEFVEDLNETTYNYSANTTLTNFFGLSGDAPVAGDWFGTGTISIGVFRCPAVGAGICSWYIDANNNGTWDGIAGGDAIWSFGLPGDLPIVGDWTGNGVSKIGVMRCPAVGQPGVCTWYLDAGDKHTYDPATVVTYNYGLPGDQPVANNWNGTGPTDQIGVFRGSTGTWIVDSAGNGNSFTMYTYGLPGDIPIVGNWQGTGRKRIGVFRGGTVILNLSGNNFFVQGIDLIGSFGLPGDLPVVGFWTN